MTKSRKSTPTPTKSSLRDDRPTAPRAQFRNRAVLAVDPGFDRIGAALLAPEKDREALLHSECIVTNKKDAYENRLLHIGARVRELIATWQPQALAIEKLFFNQNTSTALRVAEARGVIIYEAVNAELAVYEYSPQDVKIAVTSYGKADKAQVEFMVRKLLGLAVNKKMLDDELDAIALGITHLASRKVI